MPRFMLVADPILELPCKAGSVAKQTFLQANCHYQSSIRLSTPLSKNTYLVTHDYLSSRGVGVEYIVFFAHLCQLQEWKGRGEAGRLEGERVTELTAERKRKNQVYVFVDHCDRDIMSDICPLADSHSSFAPSSYASIALAIRRRLSRLHAN